MSRAIWGVAGPYERYVGRWSRLVAVEFVDWLDLPRELDWLDVGCGSGALAGAILERCAPRSVTGVDPAPGFVEGARQAVPQARFELGSAEVLPFPDHSFDATVSGLVLNFVPDPAVGVVEMARVARPGCVVGCYVWDYAGEMQLMRHFWDAAVELDPAAAELDEGRRFPLCAPESLRALFADAGLRDVEVRDIDVPTRFADFEDYWEPFLGGQGPAPAYCMSLPGDRREALRELLRSQLPVAADGSIALVARALAARGSA